MHRDTWRPQQGNTLLRSKALHISLLAVVMLALCAVLFVLLYAPFYQPATHVVLLSGGESDSMTGTPLGYASQDIERVKAAGEHFKLADPRSSTIEAPALRSAQSLRSFGNRLKSQPFASRDVVIVYAAAHGVSHGGEPYLLCGDFNGENPADSRFPLEEFLLQLRETPGAVKILLLDAGRIQSDTPGGMVSNAFPHLLRKTVQATGDESLWVLSSHAAFERGAVSHHLKASLFGWFSQQGLHGQADTDGDNTLTLRELHAYVATGVSQWVKQSAGGKMQQRPQLLWGGGDIHNHHELAIAALPSPEIQKATPTPATAPATDNATTQAAANPLAGITPRMYATMPVLLPAILAQVANQPQDNTQPQPAAGPPLPPDASALSPAALEAWQLRDKIEPLPYRERRLVDFAPHYWRQVEQRLNGCQIRARLNPADAELLAKETSQTLKPLLNAIAPPATPAADQPDIAALQSLPAINIQPSRLRSFALAKKLSQRGGPQLPAGVVEGAAALQKILATGDAAALEKWSEETYQPSFAQYAELELAAQVATLSHLSWEDKQLLTGCRMNAEATFALTLGNAGWTSERFETADNLRRAGEHLLVDGTGNDWRQQGVSFLRRANHAYQQAAAELALIQSARSQVALLMHRLPYYLRWREYTATDPGSGAPSFEDLNALLDLLPQAIATLEQPAAESIAEVAQLSTRLNEIERNLLKPVLTPSMLTEGRQAYSTRIDALLATPLPSAGALAELQAATVRLDHELATGFAMTVQQPPLQAAPEIEQWRQQVAKAGIEVKFARLAAGDATTHSREFNAIENAWKKLEKLYQELEQSQDAAAMNGQMWQAMGQLGSAFEEFHRLLPARIREATRHNLDMASLSNRQSRRHALREAALSVRLLDGRMQARTSASQRAAALDAASMYDHLLAARQRFLAAAVDVTPHRRTQLLDAASDYRRMANVQLRQPPAPVFTTPQISLQAPTAVTFAASAQKTIPLSLRVSGGSRTPGWILLQYDPEVLEVTSSRQVYHEHEMQSAPVQLESSDADVSSATQSSYPFQPDRMGLAASLYVRPGAASDFRLTLRAKKEQQESAKLIVKALASGVYIRREMMVHPPAPFDLTLKVSGPPGATTQAASGVQLHPFPNQPTSFQFSLANHAKVEKDLEVQFLAASRLMASLPATALSPATAASLLKPYGPFATLSTTAVKLAPESSAPLALPEYKAEEPAEPAPAPNGLPVAGDLLVKIIEKTTGRVMLRRIQIKPQAPVRYVQPLVSYDARQRSINIAVKPLTPDSAPPRVNVRCEVVSGLPQANGKVLRAVLLAPAKQTQLTIETPSAVKDPVVLHLHIDGYPRAFIYRVNCNYSQPQIAPAQDVLAIRVKSPLEGHAVKSPVEAIPAVFEVDAPVGAFNNENDIVELAVDLDEDRDFLREAPLRIAAARQVQVAWAATTPGGAVTFNTRVSDFHVSLPAPGIQHRRVNLLGRVQAAGKTAWTKDRYVWIDGQGPQTSSPTIAAGEFIAVGDPVNLSLLAVDQGSGVAKVEVAFDTNFDGKLPADPPPVSAKLEPGGAWTAALDTSTLAPGAYQILIQATDKTGNRGKLTKTRLEIYSPEDVKKAQANSVAGVVMYGDNSRVGGAKVTLKPEEGEPIGPVTGDENGRFELPVVPPGKYTLHAEGLFRNRVRTADVAIEVPARPVEFPPVRVNVSSSLAPKPKTR